MPSVFFDKSSGGWWRVKYRGPGGKWLSCRVLRHPGPWTMAKPPKRQPPELRKHLEKYEKLEFEAAHGIAPPTPTGKRLGAHAAEYREWFALRARPNSVLISDLAARRFLAYCAAAKIARVSDVTPDVCRGFLDSMQRDGLKRSSQVALRSYLSSWFARAADEGLVPANPWPKARVQGKPTAKPPKYWNAEELSKLIDAAEPWHRDALIVGANTGFRATALTSLEWRDVLFDRGVIVCRSESSKSGREYEVPISPACSDALGRLWVGRTGDTQRVLLNREGNPLSPHVLSTWTQVAATRAGIPLYGSWNHILRHSFASNAVLAGIPLAVVSKWMGHASITMTERYAHLSPTASQAHMQNFPVLAGSALEVH